MLPLHVPPCRPAPFEGLLTDLADELFMHYMTFLMFPQVPLGAGSVFVLCAGVRPLLPRALSTVDLFTSIL